MYVGVDVGGTFTDIAINQGDGSELIPVSYTHLTLPTILRV